MYVSARSYKTSHTHALEPGKHRGVDFADEITLGVGLGAAPLESEGGVTMVLST